MKKRQYLLGVKAGVLAAGAMAFFKLPVMVCVLGAVGVDFLLLYLL